jgi:hypothetical protein
VSDYEPRPTVTFQGGSVGGPGFYTLPDNTISRITISTGRDDVTEQPSAGYASVELWIDAKEEALRFDLFQQVSISINNSTTAGQSVIFTGVISDIELSIAAYGSVGSIAIYRLTLVGPLAELNRRETGNFSLPSQFDGDRVFDILRRSLLTEWQDVSPVIEWDGLFPDVTWDSYDAIALALVDELDTTIDRPGIYELVNQGPNIASAYELATAAAQSGRGVLWEGPDGTLNYDDYASRGSGTLYELTDDDILATSLVVSQRSGDLVNKVIVTYDDGTVSKTAISEQSRIANGELVGTRETTLKNASDAQTQADDLLRSRRFARPYVKEMTIPLHSPTVSDATKEKMVKILNGQRITSTGLPIAIDKGRMDNIVEGYVWNLTRYTAELTLKMSQYSESFPETIWFEIPATTTWAGYTPTDEEWIDV